MDAKKIVILDNPYSLHNNRFLKGRCNFCFAVSNISEYI